MVATKARSGANAYTCNLQVQVGAAEIFRHA